jgi:hypothetical protein
MLHQRKSQLAMNSGVGPEGSFILDWRQQKARLPPMDPAGHPATISLTSMRDLAQFVVSALAKPVWPREFRLRADRLDMRDLFAVAEAASCKHAICATAADDISQL